MSTHTNPLDPRYHALNKRQLTLQRMHPLKFNILGRMILRRFENSVSSIYSVVNILIQILTKPTLEDHEINIIASTPPVKDFTQSFVLFWSKGF